MFKIKKDETFFYYLCLPLFLVACAFSSCSKDNGEPKFDYPMEMLIGKWRITYMELKDGSMFDVTTAIAEKVFEPMYATFNTDGTYLGSGGFGNGSGTFSAIGKTITSYVSGEEF